MRHAAARNHLLRDGIYRALLSRMRVDPRIHLIGEGAGVKAWYDCRELHDEFKDRIITTPIAEGASVDFSVGMAIAGALPVQNSVTADFMFRAFDAIANTAAKHETVDHPRTIIFMGEFLTGGPTTGQKPEALFARIPGLSVVVPSNPIDACGLMLTALQHPGVTVFFEDREIEDEWLHPGVGLPSQEGPVPFGLAWSIRSTTSQYISVDPGITIVSYGLTFQRLRHQWCAVAGPGINYDLIDLRTLWPLDMATILDSVRRTRRLLVVEPAVQFCGIGAEIVAAVAEAEPGVRVARLGGARKTLPAAREWFDGLYPTAAQVLEAAERLCRDGEGAWLT